MPATRPPAGELGAPGVSSAGGYLDTHEDAPELRFPRSIEVYDRMRRDAQVDSILRALTLPIRGATYRLEGGGEVRPEVLRFVESELGLDVHGTPRARRRRQGIVWAEVLRHALLKLPYGFMPLEQVYEVGPPNPRQEDIGIPGLVAHLRKLAPRMPRTVVELVVARDGGLVAVVQYVPSERGPMWQEVRIPVERLAFFCNDREGGDWAGRSVLRSSYGHWLIKRELIKLGPIIVERNGMGVPVVGYPAGESKREALAIATGFRAGEEAGAALPEGWTLTLAAVQGSTKDELPLIKYHDEAMGRALLAMFLNLGHDRGALALGEVMLDAFVTSQNAVAGDVCTEFTEYAIRDLVALNFGEDEPYPSLVIDPITAESTPTAEALKALAEAGLLGPVDPELVQAVRRRYGMPQAPASDEPVLPDGTPDIVPPGLDLPDDDLDVSEPLRIAARAAAVAERMVALAELRR